MFSEVLVKIPLNTKSDYLAAYQHDFKHSLVDFCSTTSAKGSDPVGTQFVTEANSLQLRNTGKIGDLQKIPGQAFPSPRFQSWFFLNE